MYRYHPEGGMPKTSAPPASIASTQPSTASAGADSASYFHGGMARQVDFHEVANVYYGAMQMQYAEEELSGIMRQMVSIHNRHCTDINNQLRIEQGSFIAEQAIATDFRSEYPMLSNFIVYLSSLLNAREVARLAWLTGHFSTFEQLCNAGAQKVEDMTFTLLETLFSQYGTENVFDKLSDVLRLAQPQTEKITWQMMVESYKYNVENITSNNPFDMQPVHEAILSGLMDSCTHPITQINALIDYMDTSGQLRIYFDNDLASRWSDKDLYIQYLAMFHYYLTELNGSVDGIWQALIQSGNEALLTIFNAFCGSLNIVRSTIPLQPMLHLPMPHLPMPRQPAPRPQGAMRMMPPMMAPPPYHKNKAGQKLHQGWLQGQSQQIDDPVIRSYYPK